MAYRLDIKATWSWIGSGAGPVGTPSVAQSLVQTVTEYDSEASATNANLNTAISNAATALENAVAAGTTGLATLQGWATGQQ